MSRFSFLSMRSIFPNQKCFTHGEAVDINDKDVDLYNQKIIEVAHEQVYSSSKAHLEEVLNRKSFDSI